MKTSIMESKSKIKIIATAVIWLSLWELINFIIDEPVLFAGPYTVLLTLFKMMGTVEYWQTIVFSALRILLGFFVGYILSTLLAVLAYKSDWIKTFLSPAISVIKATPVASFIILALIWSGKDFVPVLICILMITPIVWSNILQGLESTDKGLLEMAHVYKMSGFDRFKSIYLPSVAPYNSAALASGLGLCWKAGIAAEVICRAAPSIGNSIWETKFYIETAEMFAWTLTVVVLSVVFDRVVRVVASLAKGRADL